MDINTFYGLLTLLMLVLFIGIVLWAYSSKRKKHFEEAANLPFEEEKPLDDDRNQRKGDRS
ncbi:cbb3-type cytochrome c oxidase subunit 3 [Methylonatrum kenyense]|uniref:cbb3-type cytochrome oxidase subunit 3 n=1 Tax=Methylonatrum kenyense TaxID=455253 RepID=UPI0020BFEFB1|nr:cbb3-type cytochrome c oxidase subunit 3 [Methylonatrum kenyense]MCK8515627.1 cbb3-type cytochrome c oxidase subunit 3 [Methylonatrum kenyense]